MTAYYIVHLKTQYHMPNGLLIFHFFIGFDRVCFFLKLSAAGTPIGLLDSAVLCAAFAYSLYCHRRCRSRRRRRCHFRPLSEFCVFAALGMQLYFVCSIDFDTLIRLVCVQLCVSKYSTDCSIEPQIEKKTVLV